MVQPGREMPATGRSKQAESNATKNHPKSITSTATALAEPLRLPVAVQLQVPGHLPVWHGIGGLLQLQDLEVHALALVWHDEIGVQRALRTTGLFSVWRDRSGESAGGWHL